MVPDLSIRSIIPPSTALGNFMAWLDSSIAGTADANARLLHDPEGLGDGLMLERGKRVTHKAQDSISVRLMRAEHHAPDDSCGG